VSGGLFVLSAGEASFVICPDQSWLRKTGESLIGASGETCDDREELRLTFGGGSIRGKLTFSSMRRPDNSWEGTADGTTTTELHLDFSNSMRASWVMLFVILEV